LRATTVNLIERCEQGIYIVGAALLRC